MFYWLCHDSRIQLLEVLNRPTTDVDFWTAFLKGKDGWLQPLNLYATYSGAKQLSGKTRTMWNRSGIMMLQVSTPGIVQRTPLTIQFFSSVSAARLIGIPSNLFPNLNIPMKHRQIGGHRVRFALRKRSSIAVGRRIRDFNIPEILWKEVEVVMSLRWA